MWAKPYTRARHENSPVSRASQPLKKTEQESHDRQIGGVASLNFTWILDERRRKRVAR